MRHRSGRSVPGVAAGGVPAPRFRARYPAVPSSVGVIRGEVEAVARECGLAGEELGDVRLAVSEAATNAVVHGSVGRGDAHVGLSIDLTDSEMLVTVRDEGNGFRPSEDSPGIGAGLFIVAAVTGHLDVRTDAEGVEVRMTFPVPLTSAKRQHDTEASTRARSELRAESRTTTGAERHRIQTAATRTRREAHVRARRTIKARRAVPRPGVGGRVWLNGREAGGVDPRYTHLERSHD